MAQPLWSPSAQRIEDAQITRFQGQLRDQGLAVGSGFADLHNWSVANPEAFWRAVWDYGGIIGEGDTSLAARVLELLQAQDKTVSTAESCTGGLVASMLTRIPGSSSSFHAGFVTYSNQIKSSLLGVSESTLERCGAVSEEVVIEMANGAIERSGSDYSIAVSGIAGPDGGTANKPVGTVWLAWGSKGDIRTRGLCWPVERSLFQTMIAAAGLDMLRRTLLSVDSEPRYFSQRSQQAD